MKFEEFASKAGKAAADVGRRAHRPAMTQVRAQRRQRALIAGSSTTAALAALIIGVVLIWSGPGSETAPAATESTTSTTASTSTSRSDQTSTTEVGEILVGSREECPVTELGDSPFTPATESPDGPPGLYRSAWFGSPGLWTMVINEGQEWDFLPIDADGSIIQKTFWWSEDFVLMDELAPNITLTLELVNGTAPTVQAGNPGTNATHPDLGEFMIVGLEIPQPGCWRVTAEYRDASLSYVVWVGDQRPQPPGDRPADLLDGSVMQLEGVPELRITDFLFEIDVPEIGASTVTVTPDPGSNATVGQVVDQAAVLEADLGNEVMLWRADREGQPFFMSVDIGGWLAIVHVGNQTAPADEVLLALAEQLQGAVGENGVVLSNYAPDLFTVYLEDFEMQKQIHLVANQCVRELLPGAVVVEDPRRGDVIREAGYASFCDEESDMEVLVFGDEVFIDRVLSDLELTRTRP